MNKANEAAEDNTSSVGVVETEEEALPHSLPSIGRNILHVCSSLTTAVREYYGMKQSDQLDVWDDLTGFQGQKRIGSHGTEIKRMEKQYEPPQMVEEALQQLPLELERMPSSCNHEALDMALKQAPDYVLSQLFLLKFLRAERFDVFAAATRICRHFHAKLKLFGKDKLGRDIMLSDLNDDDMAALKSGYLQFLEETDHGHRPVLLYYKAVSSECYKNRENILRGFWYMMDRWSDREVVQKLGITNLVYNIGGFPRQGMDYEKSRRFAYLFQAIPLRFNNYYVCLDVSPWLPVVETFAVMITRFLRVRLRVFRGTHEEVVEKLKAVGIPAEALPVTEKSELLVDNHLKWIQKQVEAENKQKDLTNLIPDEGEEMDGVEPDLVIEMDIKLKDKASKKLKKTYQMDTLENLADMI